MEFTDKFIGLFYQGSYRQYNNFVPEPNAVTTGGKDVDMLKRYD